MDIPVSFCFRIFLDVFTWLFWGFVASPQLVFSFRPRVIDSPEAGRAKVPTEYQGENPHGFPFEKDEKFKQRLHNPSYKVGK